MAILLTRIESILLPRAYKSASVLKQFSPALIRFPNFLSSTLFPFIQIFRAAANSLGNICRETDRRANLSMHAHRNARKHLDRALPIVPSLQRRRYSDATSEHLPSFLPSAHLAGVHAVAQPRNWFLYSPGKSGSCTSRGRTGEGARSRKITVAGMCVCRSSHELPRRQALVFDPTVNISCRVLANMCACMYVCACVLNCSILVLHLRDRSRSFVEYTT